LKHLSSIACTLMEWPCITCVIGCFCQKRWLRIHKPCVADIAIIASGDACLSDAFAGTHSCHAKLTCLPTLLPLYTINVTW
jgi:hypothetical protein